MIKDSPILAIETSSLVGSVALARGPQVIAQQNFTTKLRHASELLPTVDKLCQQHNVQPQDIDQLYISAGPGSFTGIRIAVTFAKTLAFAWPIKIIAVSSLESLILNVTQANPLPLPDIHYIAALLDAGRGQIFTAVFEITGDNQTPKSKESLLPGLRTIISPTLTTVQELLKNTPRPLYLTGPGLNRYADKLIQNDIHTLDEKYAQPQALNVHTIGYRMACAGRFTAPEQLQPFYLRRPEAEEKWERLHPPQ